MRTWLCCVLALGSGCIVPRSMTIGQLAAPVGRGATEVGVHTGFIYASQTNPQYDGRDATNDPIKTNERTAGFTIPAFEANLNAGFNDHVALNVHASSAGLQPGLKLTLNKSKQAWVALMPQVAFGYGSLGAATDTAEADGVVIPGPPRTQTSFTFLGGLKFLFSHRSGFYAGVGYDFIFNRNFNSVASTTLTDDSTIINTTTGHQVSASVGIDIKLGWLHLRPEVAFAVTPGIAQSVTTNLGANSVSVGPQTGGSGWAIFPGFTMAIATPPRELTSEEEQEEEEAREAEKKKKRRGGEEDDEDEDDDERPTGRKRPTLDDDEEDARKKRRPAVDEED